MAETTSVKGKDGRRVPVVGTFDTGEQLAEIGITIITRRITSLRMRIGFYVIIVGCWIAGFAGATLESLTDESEAGNRN